MDTNSDQPWWSVYSFSGLTLATGSSVGLGFGFGEILVVVRVEVEISGEQVGRASLVFWQKFRLEQPISVHRILLRVPQQTPPAVIATAKVHIHRTCCGQLQKLERTLQRVWSLLVSQGPSAVWCCLLLC